MAAEPSFTGPNKPTTEQVKEEIMKKLDLIDLSSITELTGSTRSEEAEDQAEWSNVVWTVWRR